MGFWGLWGDKIGLERGKLRQGGRGGGHNPPPDHRDPLGEGAGGPRGDPGDLIGPCRGRGFILGYFGLFGGSHSPWRYRGVPGVFWGSRAAFWGYFGLFWGCFGVISRPMQRPRCRSCPGRYFGGSRGVFGAYFGGLTGPWRYRAIPAGILGCSGRCSGGPGGDFGVISGVFRGSRRSVPVPGVPGGGPGGTLGIFWGSHRFTPRPRGRGGGGGP